MAYHMLDKCSSLSFLKVPGLQMATRGQLKQQ